MSARPDQGSTDRFGYEWGTYTEVEAAHEEQFRRWLPFYDAGFWRGKAFLDGGCGMGRNSYWPARDGARRGLAVDLDDRTLASARATLAPFPQVEVRKCSLYDIPWRDEVDVAFSIGVVHHIEFPERALAALAQATKPGGDVAIWVYGKEGNGWFLWLLDPLRRGLFSRMPIRWVHALSWLPAAVLWLALRLGLNRLEYFRLIRTFAFPHLRSIVFDQMLPKIANYWTRDEVFRLMQSAGLEDIEVAPVNEMSWAARGRKPA